MNKFIFLIVFFIVAFLFPRTISAQSRNELLPANTRIQSDYIRTAETIQIDGEIEGDVFLIGGVITINGKIGGDLFAIGGKVTVNGEVGNSIRILAADSVVNGNIGRNVLVICGNCTLTNNSAVGGSLLAVGGNLELSSAKIGRGVRFFGGRMYLNSEIANEAFVVAKQEFILGPKASVSGDLKYTGDKQVNVTSGATVSGVITYEKTNPKEDFPKFFGATTLLEWKDRLGFIVDFGFVGAILFLGYFLLGLFPKLFERSIAAMDKNIFTSFVWGSITVGGVFLIVSLLAITIIGIPASIAISLVFYLIYLLAQLIAGFYLGRKILLFAKYGERRGWALLIGLVIIYFLNYLPILGTVIKWVLIIVAVGGLVVSYRYGAIYRNKNLEILENLSDVKKLRSFKTKAKRRD